MLYSVNRMNIVEHYKSVDIRTICEDHHVEKNQELFVGNIIFLRDIHSKITCFLQVEN